MHPSVHLKINHNIRFVSGFRGRPPTHTPYLWTVLFTVDTGVTGEYTFLFSTCGEQAPAKHCQASPQGNLAPTAAAVQVNVYLNIKKTLKSRHMKVEIEALGLSTVLSILVSPGSEELGS